MNLFQITLKPYAIIPEKYQQKWKSMYTDLSYKIYSDDISLKFIKDNFDTNYQLAFENGFSKWKADLLRFCLLNQYPGLYVDVDMTPETNIFYYIPTDVDFVSSIGAFCYTLGKKEIQIALLLARSPEPLLKDFMDSIGPSVVSTGEPYSVNIAGLYSFFCKCFDVDTLEAFKVYTFKNRKYYFLKEVEVFNKGKREFKIVNENNVTIINSQAL